MTPTRPPTACPRCRSAHKGRCPQATKQKATDTFYSTHRWQRVRALKRQIDPLCQRCTAMGRTVLGSLVHHITPIKEGGAPYSLPNLETLCTACHNREHHAAA